MVKKTATAKKESYILGIEDGERFDFGTFEIVRSKQGIAYRNYTGFVVFTTPYTTGRDGELQQWSLYNWMSYLIDCKQGGVDADTMDALKILTEANVSHPMTAFIDTDRAVKFATEYMEWLKEKQEQLAKAMAQKPSDADDAAIMAVERAKVESMDTLIDVFGDMKDKVGLGTNV